MILRGFGAILLMLKYVKKKMKMVKYKNAYPLIRTTKTSLASAGT